MFCYRALKKTTLSVFVQKILFGVSLSATHNKRATEKNEMPGQNVCLCAKRKTLAAEQMNAGNIFQIIRCENNL